MQKGIGRGYCGSNAGPGMGQGKGRGGRRMAGGRASAGPGGECVCTACGSSAAHQRGIPCYGMKCPECGGVMIRK